MTQLSLALFLIGIGMSVAGTGTHLYQQLARKVAAFQIEGRNGLESAWNLIVLFICGPYMILRMGLRPDEGGQFSSVNVMLAAVIGFGWSFVTGLMLVGAWISVRQVLA